MQYDISFIHTADVHVNTFNNLIQDLAPQLNVNHIVDESLLTYAQINGIDSKLESNLEKHINELSKQSQLIVVTCSSIGGLAEKIANMNGCLIQRIDRAMADYAVKTSKNLLVLAALESTLEPTNDLLNSSLQNNSSSTKITLHHIKDCWDYFLCGDMDQYHHTIITALKLNEANYDMILLAQASMAKVENMLDLSIPIISSPKIGVEKAISTLNRLK